ncbi:hypothetical protein DL764_010795 [Monosporascus ibericus]|uniref:Uncharacterized protein n=1 Tax=Monosporascus ibericus TaxID=155417 RepID=A0A4Q4SU42_9PEZI|nr:hypothetical protein DL764_010795 [Monosporascus ibericus]
MGSLLNRFAGLPALFAAAVYARDFNVSTQYHEGGQLFNSRVWYGDGNLYVGAKVPASVQTTFNITMPVKSGVQLPDGTFLAVNNATGAKDPVLATHDASALGPEYTLNWVRWGTLLLPTMGRSSWTLTSTSERLTNPALRFFGGLTPARTWKDDKST